MSDEVGEAPDDRILQLQARVNVIRAAGLLDTVCDWEILEDDFPTFIEPLPAKEHKVRSGVRRADDSLPCRNCGQVDWDRRWNQRSCRTCSRARMRRREEDRRSRAKVAS